MWRVHRRIPPAPAIILLPAWEPVRKVWGGPQAIWVKSAYTAGVGGPTDNVFLED